MKPGGMSGGSKPLLELHLGHGMPAAPQAQAPAIVPHGRSGWASQTHRLFPHVGQIRVIGDAWPVEIEPDRGGAQNQQACYSSDNKASVNDIHGAPATNEQLSLQP